MSAVSEGIVREYFEALDFLVLQPRKYAVAARPKRPDEEIDLIVVNAHPGDHRLPESGSWNSQDVRGIQRAIVGVRGWHTDRFSPAMLETTPEIFRFAGDESVKRVTRTLGEGPVAKILCLPGLASTDELKRRSLSILKERGIDGVISFPVMLRELIGRIEVTRNYEKSDILQTLRILKNYDLLKEPQMELFRSRRKKAGHE